MGIATISCSTTYLQSMLMTANVQTDPQAQATQNYEYISSLDDILGC